MIYTIKKYNELSDWVNAFQGGSFGLFLIVGPPGCSKSRTITQSIPARDRLYIRGGGLTAYQLYKELYIHRNKMIILDDLESVYSDKQLVRLLKSLTETEDEREIRWTTANKALDSEGIPRSFTTTSKVCIITNRMTDGLNEHIGSLVDRGIMLKFNPSPRTVFQYGQNFFFDKEILNFIEEHLDFVTEFSLRVFETASQTKRSKLNWREAVLETLGIQEIVLVHDLMRNGSFATDEERVRVFMRKTGLSRPMYHKYRDVIEEKLGKPKRVNHAKKRSHELVGV